MKEQIEFIQNNVVMGDIQEEEAHIPGDEHRMSRSEPTTLIFCSVWDERRY